MKPGSRTFPPVLVAGLVVMWLLLNQTLALGYVALGGVLAFGIAWASASLRPLTPRFATPRFEMPRRILVLMSMVLVDIVRSNIGVARIVLGLVRDREIKSGFVNVPLELRDPHGLAVLAAILTSTPGTVWIDLAADGSRVTIHVLDLKDEGEWIAWIKNRYERQLLRIFR